MNLEPGMPVVYRGRHFVFVRFMPGLPRQAVIVDDEDQEMRVNPALLYPA